MSFFGENKSLGATSTPTKPYIFSCFGTSTSGASAFGTTTATAPTAFLTQTANTGSTLYGQPTAGAATTSTFGASKSSTFGTGFGTAPTAKVPPTLGSFDLSTSTTTTTPFAGFGSTQPATDLAKMLNGFNRTGTTTTVPAFGSFGSGRTNFGGFGTAGKPATSTVTPGFSGFSGATKLIPEQQAPQILPDQAFAQAIYNVNIFGDERDVIVAKLNYLQGLWGKGKAFYSQTARPIKITTENSHCRFKAIDYSPMPGKDNKIGHVGINFGKPQKDVTPQHKQIIKTINDIIGNKPNYIVHIDHSKEIEDNKSQVVIYVERYSQSAPNTVRRILATDLSNFLNQPAAKNQLNNLGVIEVLALVSPDQDELKEYLANAPKGIDPSMWRQAVIDNPDSKEFIPVPMIGFGDLKSRHKCQQHETDMHASYLKEGEKQLTELKQRLTAVTAKIMKHNQKSTEQSRNAVKIIVKQESTRALTPEDEAFRTKLENMQAMVSSTTHCKCHLSELLSQMRMQCKQHLQNGRNYTLEKDAENELKDFLTMQQKAMEVLTDTVSEDMKALQIIIDGLPQLLRK